MFYKVILSAGHLGAGKSYDLVRYLRDDDTLSAFLRAVRLPRVKSKSKSGGVKLIERVSYREYIEGKKKEALDPYLNYGFAL